MLLPFREHLDFGPTPYDLLQAKEGIPIVKGNVVADVAALELGTMGTDGRVRLLSQFIAPAADGRLCL